MSDTGPLSPSGSVSSSMRQNLDELVSKILEEDSSYPNKQSDDVFSTGVDERKFSLGRPVTNSDFDVGVRNIWSDDGKVSLANQIQLNMLNNSAPFNGNMNNSAAQSNWETLRLVSAYPQNQNILTAGSQLTVDQSALSMRRPGQSLTADNISHACNQKIDANAAKNFGSYLMKGSPEMEIALRCLEKSVPFVGSQHKHSGAPNPFETWPKVPGVCPQDLTGNQGFIVCPYPNGSHSNLSVANVGAAGEHLSETLLADVKTMQSVVGSDSVQANAAAKQYLAQCLNQSNASGEPHDSYSFEDQCKQQKLFYNAVESMNQNGLMPPVRPCISRVIPDQNIAYGNNKIAASALTNGQNISMRPTTKYPFWPASTIPGGSVPTSAILNALATEKRESDIASMNSLASCGNLLVDQNQQFGYFQPVGKKGTYLTSGVIPCQNIPVQLQSEGGHAPENIFGRRDVPVFQPETLYQQQQQPKSFQFDLSNVPKVIQSGHNPVRGIQPQWLGSQPQSSDNCECNARCDVHNVGRVTPIILRPGEIFYNNLPSSAVLGLPPQYVPDLKLQRNIDSSNGLLICLEECVEQLRNLEKEEKEVESELMQHSLGRCLASTNASTIPRLPSNPSRVNRLVVDSLREHSKVSAILGKLKKIYNQPLHANICSAMETWMEGIRKVQARRKEEIVSCANRSNSGGSRAQEEKDILALTAAVEELLGHTRRARTCLWCAMQISLYSGVIPSEKLAVEPGQHMGSMLFSITGNWQAVDTECFNGSQKCM